MTVGNLERLKRVAISRRKPISYLILCQLRICRRDSKECWVICDFKEKMEGHVAERDLNSKTQDAERWQPTMGASKDSKE